MFQSIKARLLGIFLSLGILSVLIYVLSFYLIQSSEERFLHVNSEIERLNKLMLRDIKVTRDFFSNETINSSYFETGKSDYLESHRKICAQMNSSLKSLEKNDEKLGLGIKKDCDKLKLNFDHYCKTLDTIFSRITIRGFKDYNLEGRMRVMAHRLEDLGSVIEPEQILILRRHEKDFIIRQDDAYQKKFHDQANSIKTHLTSSINSRKREQIITDIENYESKFDSLVFYDKQIGLKSQQGLKRRIDKLADETDQSLSILFQNASASGHKNIIRLQNILLFFWIVLGLSGILICVLISNRISSSIISLKSRMNEFVESDFTKRSVIPIKNSNYEIDVLSNNFSILEQHIVNQMRTLRVKNKELEMFIYRASHDVKTPLISLNKIIERSKKNSEDPAVIEQLEKGSIIVESLNDILEELSLVRSIHSGSTDLEEVDAYALIKKCIAALQSMKGFEDVVFRTTVNMQNTFCSDIKFIRIILRNLIENCIKYRTKSGKTSFVDISFEELENRMVKITVTDNGIGIKKELQKNIFDMFFRATEEGKGNGLGLYIVQNALQKLHGAIKVKSDEGKGSSFIVYLPDATRTSSTAQRIVENRIVFPSRDEFALDYL